MPCVQMEPSGQLPTTRRRGRGRNVNLPLPKKRKISSHSAATLFRHDQLPGPRDIRLLHIFRRTRFGKHCCHIYNVSLDKLPCAYTAISYTWGDPVPRRSFPCADGRNIAITDSVACLLYYLTLESDDFTIWIDAICINQCDVSEKGHQIRLMRDIYASATTVLVWLGPPSEDSSSSFLQIRATGNEYGSLRDGLNNDETEVKLDKHDSHWLPLARLFCRPWFQRIWVLQEVALAKEIVVACGQDRVEWELFINSNRLIWDSNLWKYMRISGSTPIGFTNVHLMAQLRDDLIRGGPRSLEGLLSRAPYFEATDARDKIFALLGAATDVGDEAFNPDYSNSPEIIYIRVFKILALRSKDLYFLAMSGVGFSRRLSQLPSWVPDLTARPPCAPLGILSSYSASGTSDPQIRVLTYNQLAVYGIIVDTVDSLGLSFDKEHSSSEYIARVQEFAMQAKLLEPYPTGESRYEVFWRAIITNKNAARQVPAPSTYGKYMQCYLSNSQSSSRHQHAYGEHDADCCQIYQDRFHALLVSCGAFTRRMCTTRGGYLGLTWKGTAKGDKVCIFLGSSVPFIIRENPMRGDQGRTYTLVGGCYIHGMMNGEGMKMGEAAEIVLA